MVPEDLAVARVNYRKRSGGHGVPVDKIRGRYGRLWPIVAAAAAKADSATFWDNAAPDGPRRVAMFIEGIVVGITDWPAWAPVSVTDCWSA
jgi:predicted ABC-type ATPase